MKAFEVSNKERANIMKDPMLEIVSAVLDRTLFLGVAFTFFPYFFYPSAHAENDLKTQAVCVVEAGTFLFFSKKSAQ